MRGACVGPVQGPDRTHFAQAELEGNQHGQWSLTSFSKTWSSCSQAWRYPEKKWYLFILQQLGRDRMEQWHSSIKDQVNIEDPRAIIKAFKKGFKLEETYWTYRSIYLSSSKQAKGESAATLATWVEDLVNLCKWPEEQREQRHIDLFYHLTDYFNVHRYVQNETAKEGGGGNLTWDSLVMESKRQEHVSKEYARFRRENGDSSTPSYGDPALAADAISRGFKRPQPRSQMPSGGKGSQQQCDRCGKAQRL